MVNSLNGGKSKPYPPRIVVAGVARSGTTWLRNIINYAGVYRTLFEPLHLDKGIELRKQFPIGRYIQPSYHDSELRAAVHEMLEGNYRNAFVDHHTPTFDNSYTLFKEIRLNFALKWVHAQFPTIPMVFIIRHPAATIHSHLNMKWEMDEQMIALLLSQPRLMQEHLNPFRGVFASADNQFMRVLLLWCATHYVLLRQFHAGEMYWIAYENLMMNPEIETERLFSFLNIPYDRDRITSVIQQPSETSIREPLKDNVDEWQRTLTHEQQTIVFDLLKIFGLDSVYNTLPLPNMEALHTLLASKTLPVPNRAAILRWQFLYQPLIKRVRRRL